MTAADRRRITANLALTLDGRYHGPQGPADFGMFAPYVASEAARNHLDDIWADARTAVLGRINAEGFLGYWPAVAVDESADPRDRAYAEWLTRTEKVVFSRTLEEAPGESSRLVAGDVPEILGDLSASGSGDILVNSSASIIRPLLRADMIDRLFLLIVPEVAGDGPRLFEDGMPGTAWTLVRHRIGEQGEAAFVYDRRR